MLSPLEMTQIEFADLCKVTRESVRLWEQEGMPGVTKPTRNACYIDLRAALPWVRDTKWTGADDRARLARIKADDAQLDLNKKLGTLMDVADAEKVWVSACSSMRARILSVPPVAQQRLGLTTGQAGILRDLIHEALEALSGRMDAPEDDGSEEVAQVPVRPLPAGQKRRGRKSKSR